MTEISKSIDRGSFRINSILKQVEEGALSAEEAEQQLALSKSWQDMVKDHESQPEWQQNNMEYDLCSTPWIIEKVRSNNVYAQHLYAAICNNCFQENKVWPALKNQTWSASWRSAGGIIADMQGKGDYIDWYCSGIKGDALDEEQLSLLDHEQKERYLESTRYVSESVVTEEIRADLFRLGWIVLDRTEDLYI
jgi:hypothetical protein